MNDFKPYRLQTAGYCVLIGILLRAENRPYSLFCFLGMLLLLGSMGCAGGAELLLVASILSGNAVCHVLNILVSGGAITFNKWRVFGEPLLIGVFSIILLIKRNRGLAMCLIIYLFGLAVSQVYLKLTAVVSASWSGAIIAAAMINGLTGGLLISWFVKTRD